MVEESQIQAKKQAAFVALQSGAAQTASRHLVELSEILPHDVSIWMGLAVASMQISELEPALEAIDKALELQPQNFPILLMKADILQAGGDTRGAASFYQAAVMVAPPEDQRTEKMQAEVARATQVLGEANAEYEGILRSRLAGEGYLTEAGETRFDQAVDLMFGKRQIYLQEPHDFYFPGLPQIQFYDRSDFEWVPALEKQTEAIAAEALQVMNEDIAAFKPYLRASGGPQLQDMGLLNNIDWSALYLIEMGQVVEENAARCPVTMEALKSVPLCEVSDKMPSVLFSLLRPNTRIAPHNGLFNSRLICHLPLIVPGNGTLRVGNETRHWQKSEMLIFDDSMEHEAFNGSDEPRVVLLFDIWRPEFSDRDKDFIRAVFRAIEESAGDGAGT